MRVLDLDIFTGTPVFPCLHSSQVPDPHTTFRFVYHLLVPSWKSTSDFWDDRGPGSVLASLGWTSILLSAVCSYIRLQYVLGGPEINSRQIGSPPLVNSPTFVIESHCTNTVFSGLGSRGSKSFVGLLLSLTTNLFLGLTRTSDFSGP